MISVCLNFHIKINTHERLILPDKFVGLLRLSSQYKPRVSPGLVKTALLYKLVFLLIQVNHV